MNARTGFQASTLVALALFGTSTAIAQNVNYQTENGINYRVTTQQVQVPETTMREQTQTVYRQQLTTDNLQSTHLVTVPNTQYRLVSRMRGRWNPFVTPYWTHHYEPVTTWSQQAATVSVPVSRLAWVPETRVVQSPVTTYRTAQRVIKEPVSAAPSTAGGQQYASNSSPSATLAAVPSGSRTASLPIGGRQLNNDPPSQPTGTGWQPNPGYR